MSMHVPGSRVDRAEEPREHLLHELHHPVPQQHGDPRHVLLQRTVSGTH